MIGHLGSRASALLDGQLPPAEAERCWQHVRHCHLCRDLIEREGWVKARLSALGGDGSGVPGRLAQALREPGRGSDHAAGAGRTDPVDRSRTRLAGLALGGACALAVVLGFSLLAFVPGSADDLPPPTASLSGDGAGATGAQTPQPVLPGHRFVPVRAAAR